MNEERARIFFLISNRSPEKFPFWCRDSVLYRVRYGISKKYDFDFRTEPNKIQVDFFDIKSIYFKIMDRLTENVGM